MTQESKVEAACEFFGELSARSERGVSAISSASVVEHARTLVNEIARLERALIDASR